MIATLLIIILNVTISGCGSDIPQAGVRAVTDRKLTLGLVSGERRGYRLVLCKGEQTSSDTSNCEVALFNRHGQEAVFSPSDFRRSFFAEYKGYALGAFSLVAVPVVATVVWWRWLARSKNLLARDQKGLQASGKTKVDMEEQIDGTILDLEKSLKKADNDFTQDVYKIVAEDMFPKLEEVDADLAKEIKLSLYKKSFGLEGNLSDFRLAELSDVVVEVTEREKDGLIRAIDWKETEIGSSQLAVEAYTELLADMVRKIADPDQSNLTDKITIDSVSLPEKEIARLDKTFADNFSGRKNSFHLGADGLSFYKESEHLGVISTDFFVDVVMNLHYLERKKRFLLDLKAGHVLDVAEAKKKIYEIDRPIPIFYHDVLDEYYNLFPSDKILFEEVLPTVEAVPGFSFRFDKLREKGGELYRRALMPYHEIRIKQESINLYEGIKDGSVDLNSTIAQVEDEIGEAKDIFFNHKNFATIYFADDIVSEDGLKQFHLRLKDLDLYELSPSQMIEKVNRFRQQIETNKEERVKLQQKLEAIPQKIEQIRDTIDGFVPRYDDLKEKMLNEKRYAESLHKGKKADLDQQELDRVANEQEERDIIKHKVRELEEQHRRKKKIVVAAVAGAGVTLLGIISVVDRFVWGYDERQESRYWRSVLQEDVGMTKVSDVQVVLHSIAKATGYTVNPKALSLAN